MSSQVASNEYIFKMPFATSIHPQLMMPGETLSILHDINASLPPSKRLPHEVLVQIKNEVHGLNRVWHEVRSTWTVLPVNKDETSPLYWDAIANHMFTEQEESLPLSNASLDHNLMEYNILETSSRFLLYTDPRYKASIHNMHSHISSADVLYRVRCFFPEAYVASCDGYKAIWLAAIRHNQTGFGLAFSEHKGAVSLRVHLDSVPSRVFFHIRPERTPEYCKKLESFSKDSIRLLNAFIETAAESPGGEPHFHPTARASRPSSESRYIAVPTEIVRERIDENSNNNSRQWVPVLVSAADPSRQSSLRSLLPNLKYNIKTRMIDPINGTTPLTDVISSALLYYRLLCLYPIETHGNATVPFPIQGSGSDDAAITNSVWQMKFIHPNNSAAHILFMDDRGLFDIRANEEAAKTVLNDIVSLINMLCSDDCAHPYDGTVAGCVA